MEITLRNTVLEIINKHKILFNDYVASYGTYDIDKNSCFMFVEKEEKTFSIKMMKKENKIKINDTLNLFKTEINNKDLDVFIHGFIIASVTILTQLNYKEETNGTN